MEKKVSICTLSVLSATIICVCACKCVYITPINFPRKKKIKNIQTRVRSSQTSRYRRSNFRDWDLGEAALFWFVTADSLTPAGCLWCVFLHQEVKEVSPWRLYAAGIVQECSVQRLRGCTETSIACQEELQPVQCRPLPRAPLVPQPASAPDTIKVCFPGGWLYILGKEPGLLLLFNSFTIQDFEFVCCFAIDAQYTVQFWIFEFPRISCSQLKIWLFILLFFF